MNKKQSTVFITGASSGIGLSCVNYFLSKGWRVVVTVRKESDIKLFNSSSSLFVYQLDVTDAELVSEVVQKAWVQLGGIQVVVNNAGYGVIGPFEGASMEQIQHQLDVNYFGMLSVVRAFLPLLREQGGGTIINVSSVAGRVGFPFYSVYNASKFAVEGFTESLAYELKPFSIHVKLIEPGPVKTRFNGNSSIRPSHPDYNEMLKTANLFYEQLFNRADEPQAVAKTIYKASIDRSFRLRYTSGMASKALLVMRYFLPYSIFRFISMRLILK